MAESMAGLKRSCRCAEVTEANVGQEMTLMGWVQKSRNKGGIIFTDLRDRSGIIQIIFEESDCGAESFAKAEKLRSEFTVAVVGTIEKRSGAANPNLKTGTIEMRGKEAGKDLPRSEKAGGSDADPAGRRRACGILERGIRCADIGCVYPVFL